MSSNVADFLEFRRSREDITSAPQVDPNEDSDSGKARWVLPDSTEREGFLVASAFSRLSPETSMSKFVEAASVAINNILACKELLDADDYLGADDKFMAAKSSFAELLMFRDVGDSVALLSSRFFITCSQVRAITDYRELPAVLLRALTRICSAPYMKFEEAVSLADEIESVTGPLHVPGYNELVADLIETP